MIYLSEPRESKVFDLRWQKITVGKLPALYPTIAVTIAGPSIFFALFIINITICYPVP